VTEPKSPVVCGTPVVSKDAELEYTLLESEDFVGVDDVCIDAPLSVVGLGELSAEGGASEAPAHVGLLVTVTTLVRVLCMSVKGKLVECDRVFTLKSRCSAYPYKYHEQVWRSYTSHSAVLRHRRDELDHPGS
jgi:hypothetical protein